jgi:signal transduction histidine kinase
VVFPDSQDQHVILVVRDITGVVKLQELVRQSELMSAMGELVGNVAHEVRNPLFSISATLDAFEVHSANRKEYQKYRVVLRRELSRLNQMMQELLDYGKPASLNLSKSNIVDVMRDAVQSCLAQARSAAAKIKVDVSGPIADLEMDRVRMFQVFQNLIQNALQHSPPGSVISLQAKHCHDDGRPWIECTVEDCGSGFRAQDLPKVFTPFFSRRREGTGLGLPLARRIVQQHGGTISAGNRKEGGAVIKVRIPAFDWKTPDPQLASLSVH